MDLCSEQALLHKSNVSEDEPVADADDDERQYHADDDEEDGVVVGGGPVPETLLGLGVEAVWRPADVVRWVQRDAGRPRQNDGDDGAAASKHRVVGGRPADVQVPVDCDDGDR